MKDTLSRVLAILALVVGLATLVALYVVWSLAMENKSVFTDMLNGYGDRIAALEEKEAMAEDDQEVVDNRPLMPEQYTGSLPPNFDDATTTVEYQNVDFGIAMQLPYNPVWGNAQYRVAPYQEFDYGEGNRGIHFGSSFPFEGGGWAREYSLIVRDPLTAEDQTTQTLADNEDFLLEDRPMEELNVNGKVVLLTYTGGLCDIVQATVIGEKANYTLYPTCGATDDVREDLLDIVRTMEFIN